MFQLGSISSGTLRTEDLLQAFVEQYRLRNLNTNPRLGLEAGRLIRIAGDREWTDDEHHSAGMVCIALQDALQESCPPFVYFGAHPGDGADFGFWPDMDSLNEAIDQQGERGFDECWLDDGNVIVQVSDHGNVTVMDMNREIFWSVV